MWAGTYDRHVPFKNIEQLRKLIQASFAQELAKPCDPGIVLNGLSKNRLLVVTHGAKLVAIKNSIVFSMPFLHI